MNQNPAQPPRIQRLDDNLVAQIAAGEVIESPAAIVKELVENSLDAGATEIEILIAGDGFDEIQVRDNGHGIHPEDLPLAVESFATSKIRSLDELIAAESMGFRGEALGSIASVSRLRIESRWRHATHAMAISVADGTRQVEPSAMDRGTRVVVRDLFYNVPVRRDYFSNAAKIRRQLSETITGLTAAHPEVGFRYSLNEDEPVTLPARTTLIERLRDIWGEKIGDDLLPIFYESNGMQLEGYMSRFYFYRSHAGDMRLWVNQRQVQYKPLTMLLRHAYGELMPKGKFPFSVLFLRIATRDVDANVHPQKREVRFRHELPVQQFLREAFTRTISAEGGVSASAMVRLPQVKPVSGSTVSVSPPQPAESARLFESLPPLQLADESPLPAIPENLVFHSRLFNTFILASNDEGIFLIDQHTAHERINYERFLDLLAAKDDITQRLVQPLPVSAALFERTSLRRAGAALTNMGFVLEDMGPAGYALRGVPGYIDPGEEQAALETALRIIEQSDLSDAGELFDQLAKDLSCRHAIRKGESASLPDFRELTDRLRRCRNPMRCPHGRPTLVKIDEREVFAFFKRQAGH
ncbi:MAG: DNA mismatch repair endonuclease MutL [Spirochaetota bacterium]